MNDCFFCQIFRGNAPAEIVWGDRLQSAVVIAAPDPIAPGHVIVLPRRHVAHFSKDWEATSQTMRVAFKYARWIDEDYDLMTSRDARSTQHLQVHLIPLAQGAMVLSS